MTRQYGSGGSVVARQVAERLGWTLIDNEFVEQVARLAGLPPEEVAR
ncbi:MAG: cytidylate kinase family protein, partial [Myxococcota bacterium]